MLDKLSEKLQLVLNKIKEKGKISESDIKQSLREVKLVLLEADVHYKVVKDFIAKLEQQATQEKLSKTLTPGQQIIKMTHEILTEILGEKQSKIKISEKLPTTILLIGLQGSGKTTTAAKLGLNVKNDGYMPLLVATDRIRPAAIEQLSIMGKNAGVEVFTSDSNKNTLGTIYEAEQWAKIHKHDVIIIDTAGRLHIDQDLIQELKDIKNSISVDETLLILDALMGQDALRVANDFNNEVGVDGFILTKLDGDARGGVALSIRSITGLPIKFIGVGEKINDLELFYPDRISSRILGMGDTLTLIEKIEANYARNEIQNIGKKEFRDQFNLNDFYEQLKKIKKMGSLENIFNMMPIQFSSSLKNIKQNMGDEEKGLSRVEAIICSMTKQEKLEPDIIDGSRRRRIAKGSGTNVSDVNRLLNQFFKMKKFLKCTSSKKSLISFMR
ncbi:MAG: signal recognition particle protein [Atribacterota bacterium]|nr:signal recognition particle protein [Atribacterota bacterium]MDD4896174.1 signal recognition particle protein [Atribacterota bacterium]MDD5637667.1 signal recognition particle protein [Atribacterota bacterium]